MNGARNYMALKRPMVSSLAFVATALSISACGGDDNSGNDDGIVQIETSPETELGADGGDSADSGVGGEADESVSDGSTVVLAGATHEYTVMCAREPGDVELAMSGVAAAGPFNAGFGAGADLADSISVAVDGEAWRVESDVYGEFLTLDVDVDAGTAVGTATFESTAGDTAEGSFDLVCSNL